MLTWVVLWPCYNVDTVVFCLPIHPKLCHAAPSHWPAPSVSLPAHLLTSVSLPPQTAASPMMISADSTKKSRKRIKLLIVLQSDGCLTPVRGIKPKFNLGIKFKWRIQWLSFATDLSIFCQDWDRDRIKSQRKSSLNMHREWDSWAHKPGLTHLTLKLKYVIPSPPPNLNRFLCWSLTPP